MLQTPPRFTDPTLPPLDEADRRLVALLAADGRASGRELAQATGLSEANVSRRLARLFEEKSVRVAGFVPPEYLGYHSQFALFLRARTDSEALAKRLAEHPAFNMVMTCYGLCDVIAYGAAAHGSDLIALLDKHIYGQQDIGSVELRSVIMFNDPARQPNAPDATSAPRPLDATDRRIIEEVQREGRISFTDLATTINISPTSAADRFRRLLADGIIRILGMPDPYRVGLLLTGYMHVRPSRPTAEVIRALQAYPELSFFVLMSGPRAVACEFQVRDTRHFDELCRRVLSTPGVADIETCIHRKVHCMSFAREIRTPVQEPRAVAAG